MQAANPDPIQRRELWPFVLIVLSSLPLFCEHLRNLWQVKPHYQFFPLLLIGCACLLWQRWPRGQLNVVPSRLGFVFLGGGLMVLTAAVLLYSPWLAGIAMLLTIAGAFLRLQGWATARDWLPPWALLWLLIPPPLGWDLLFIQRLQSLTSRAASLILDTQGVWHLMEGNVLILPGHRLLVEEACSGVNSTFVFLAATALYVVATRRPLLRSGLLLVSSVGWSAVGNIVRVVAIAVAQAKYGLDWSTGWQHEALGVCTFALGFWMLVSTDLLLAFLLGPIVVYEDDGVSDTLSPVQDSDLDLLTRVWNWLVVPRSSPTNRELAGRPAQPMGRGSSKPADGGRLFRWLTAAFVGLGLLQLATWGTPISLRQDERNLTQALTRADQFKRSDLPETIGDWTQVDYRTEEHDRTMGRFRHIWTYRSGESECMISIEYPFSEWHNLSNCYIGIGWQIDQRQQRQTGSAASGDVAPYIETKLTKPGDQRALLLFCNVKQPTGEVLQGYSVFSMQRMLGRLNRNRLSRDTLDILQIQAFDVSMNSWSNSEREAIRKLYVAARREVLAVLATQ